jgi:hypothetical protein
MDAGGGHSRGARSTGKRRRRRHEATIPPKAAGLHATGAIALIMLLAVVLVMIVVYFTRRLMNAERAIKRTTAEVRHQITPDDLNTAFGQWVEANPGAVTTACAPYINRSVAVAATAMRVHAPPPPSYRAPPMSDPAATHSRAPAVGSADGYRRQQHQEAPAPMATEPPRHHQQHHQLPPPPPQQLHQQPQQTSLYRPESQPSHGPMGSLGQQPSLSQRPMTTHSNAPQGSKGLPASSPSPRPMLPTAAAAAQLPETAMHERTSTQSQGTPPRLEPPIEPKTAASPIAGRGCSPRQHPWPPLASCTPRPRVQCHGDVCIVVDDCEPDDDDDGKGISLLGRQQHADPRSLWDSTEDNAPELEANSSGDESDEEHDEGDAAEWDDDYRDAAKDGDGHGAAQPSIPGGDACSRLDQFVRDTLDALSHASTEDEDDHEYERETAVSTVVPLPADMSIPAADDIEDDEQGDPWLMPDPVRIYAYAHGDESDDEDDREFDDAVGRVHEDPSYGKAWAIQGESVPLMIILGESSGGLGVRAADPFRARITPLSDDDGSEDGDGSEDDDRVESDRDDDGNGNKERGNGKDKHHESNSDESSRDDDHDNNDDDIGSDRINPFATVATVTALSLAADDVEGSSWTMPAKDDGDDDDILQESIQYEDVAFVDGAVAATPEMDHLNACGSVEHGGDDDKGSHEIAHQQTGREEHRNISADTTLDPTNETKATDAIHEREPAPTPSAIKDHDDKDDSVAIGDPHSSNSTRNEDQTITDVVVELPSLSSDDDDIDHGDSEPMYEKAESPEHGTEG